METIPLKFHDLPSHTAFAGKPPDILYHYTNLNGAYGIITSKSLWLTKIKYLNDISELTFSIKLFQDYLSQFVKKLNDNSKIEFLNKASYQLNSFENTNICIASFCENNNLLSQWRSYGDDDEGIAIGLSSEILQKYYPQGLINLWKCIYDQRIQLKIMHELIEALCRSYDICYLGRDKNKNIFDDIIGYFNTLFLRIAPIIKNYHFREEKEWRLVTVPISSKNSDYNVKLVTNRRLIPVYELKFKVNSENKFECVREVVIGPSAKQYSTSETMGVLLDKNNFDYSGIIFSDIPYRRL